MTGVTYITLQSFIYTEMKIKRRAPVSLANISYLIASYISCSDFKDLALYFLSFLLVNLYNILVI